MACVGIVGGLGVGATVDYYRRITAACKARGIVPDLVFVHADVDRVFGLTRWPIISRVSSSGWAEPAPRPPSSLR